MSSLKNMLDQIEIPESTISPLEVLQCAMHEKEMKRKKDEKLFLFIQLILLLVLGYLLTMHMKTFVWIQVPITFAGVLAAIKMWWKGERSHGS